MDAKNESRTLSNQNIQGKKVSKWSDQLEISKISYTMEERDYIYKKNCSII